MAQISRREYLPYTFHMCWYVRGNVERPFHPIPNPRLVMIHPQTNTPPPSIDGGENKTGRRRSTTSSSTCRTPRSGSWRRPATGRTPPSRASSSRRWASTPAASTQSRAWRRRDDDGVGGGCGVECIGVWRWGGLCSSCRRWGRDRRRVDRDGRCS